MNVIEQIKESLDIGEVIGMDYTVVGNSTAEHDSLKFDTDKGLWNWFSRDQGGDVISWFGYKQYGDSYSDRDGEMFQVALH